MNSYGGQRASQQRGTSVDTKYWNWQLTAAWSIDTQQDSSVGKVTN